MNFLAHLFLTSNQPEKVVMGNFIADAVKGKKGLEAYDKSFQLGIKIHREIDSFTDSHMLFQKGTKRLHTNYGKFSPIIMDIYYDHILASNWDHYSELPLQEFARSQYELIERHYTYLPERTKLWFGFMKTHDLLFNYKKEEGIDFVFKRMDTRTGGISGMRTAINELREFKGEYTDEFEVFFGEIRVHLGERFFKIIND